MTKNAEYLTKKILEKTLEITKRFPELSKYISEMPLNSSKYKEGEIQDNSLEEYLNSLNELMNKYELSQDQVPNSKE